MPAFITMPSGAGPDSSQFSYEKEDPTLRSETEGGYEYTRRKHTRAPRLTFNVGYRDLTEADRVALDAFWDTVVGSVIFTWTHPVTSTVYNVRFTGPIQWKYAGVGAYKRWDCNFQIRTA